MDNLKPPNPKYLLFEMQTSIEMRSPGGSGSREPDCNAGDRGSIPGSEIVRWFSKMTGSIQFTVFLNEEETIKFELKCFPLTAEFSSVAQSYLTLCHPMDCSTPGFPVRHQLPELAQTHFIQPSHPLSSPSLLAFNPSQNQLN